MSRPSAQGTAQGTAPKATQGRQARFRLLWRLARYAVLLLTLAITFEVAYAIFTLAKMPVGGFDPTRPSMVIAADGTPVGPLSGDVSRLPAALQAMPPYLPEAFIASEDIRFRQHPGIDLRGIGRAMLVNLRSGEIREGGSTITQQVVKNTFLTSRRTLRRKVQEAVMAVALERRSSKDEILSLYVNQIYLGNGAYGVGAAAKIYFNKDVSDLTLAEAATLAGITPAPESFNPLRHPELAVERRNLVLDRMVTAGVIDEAQAAAVKKEPLKTSPGSAKGENPFPWYRDAVREELKERFGLDERAVDLMGLKIHTNLDPALQRAAQRALAVKRFPASAPDGLEGAFVAIDPRTGGVRALVGGRQYAVAAGFNRATQGQVSPGSTLKPITVYAPAFEYAGMTPDTLVADTPFELDGWKPKNWDGQFRGDVTVREAARISLNIPTIRMMEKVGVKRARSFAETLGIPFAEQDQSLTLALGGMARGLSPLQLAAAYQPFANGGTYREPHLIVRVEAADGRLSPRSLESRRVMRSRTAYLVTDLLKTVVQSGTGSQALLDRPMAGKTGTVELPDTPEFKGQQGNAAAWFVGYTPDLVGAVWLGYDQVDKAHYLPASVNGSTFPTTIWREVVGAALAGQPALAFPGPDGKVPQPARQTAAPPPPKPAKPEPVKLPGILDLKAAPSDMPGGVALTWKADLQTPMPATGAFLVFRGSTPDFQPGKESTVGVVSTAGFIDTPAKPGSYFYRVAVLDLVTQQTGPVSGTVQATVAEPGPPKEPGPPPKEPGPPPKEPEPPPKEPEPPPKEPEPPPKEPEPPPSEPEPPPSEPEPPPSEPEPPPSEPEPPPSEPEPPTEEPAPPPKEPVTPPPGQP